MIQDIWSTNYSCFVESYSGNLIYLRNFPHSEDWSTCKSVELFCWNLICSLVNNEKDLSEVCGLVYLFVINKNVRKQAVSEELIQSSVQGHFQLEGIGKRHGVLYQKFHIHSGLDVVVGWLWCLFFFFFILFSFGFSLVGWLVFLSTIEFWQTEYFRYGGKHCPTMSEEVPAVQTVGGKGKCHTCFLGHPWVFKLSIKLWFYASPKVSLIAWSIFHLNWNKIYWNYL